MSRNALTQAILSANLFHVYLTDFRNRRFDVQIPSFGFLDLLASEFVSKARKPGAIYFV